MPDVGTLVRQRLADQQQALRDAEAAVRSGQPGAVHDLRVAMRRLRSLLATFRPVFDASVTEPVRSELKAAAGRLGRSRDAEVAADHTDHLLDGADIAGLDEEAVAGLQARLRLDAVASEDVVDETLASTRYAALTVLLDDLVSDPHLSRKAQRSPRAYARKRLRREGRRLAERARAARVGADAVHGSGPRGGAGPSDDHAALLHEVRKAAKRLRYGAETASPVSGRKVRLVRKRAKRVQSLIGQHHDAVMTRATLRHLALDEAVGEAAAFLLGHLDADEQRTMATLEERAWRAVDDLQHAVDALA